MTQFDFSSLNDIVPCHVEGYDVLQLLVRCEVPSGMQVLKTVELGISVCKEDGTTEVVSVDVPWNAKEKRMVINFKIPHGAIATRLVYRNAALSAFNKVNVRYDGKLETFDLFDRDSWSSIMQDDVLLPHHADASLSSPISICLFHD